jgi:hypothetical protein
MSRYIIERIQSGCQSHQYIYKKIDGGRAFLTTGEAFENKAFLELLTWDEGTQLADELHCEITFITPSTRQLETL